MVENEAIIGLAIEDINQNKINIERINLKELEINPQKIVDLMYFEKVHGGLNLNEFIFMSYFLKKGFRMERLPLAKNDEFTKYALITYKRDFGIDSKECFFENGVPDFFFFNYDTKEWFFLECKDFKDHLNPNQIKWNNKYKFKNYKLIRFAPIFNEDKTYRSDEEVIREISKITKSSRLRYSKRVQSDELYPQNNTQDTPKPLESGHNSSYTQQEKA